MEEHADLLDIADRVRVHEARDVGQRSESSLDEAEQLRPACAGVADKGASHLEAVDAGEGGGVVGGAGEVRGGGGEVLFNRYSNEKGLCNLRRKGRRNEEPGGLDIADDRFDQVIARFVLHKRARWPRLLALSAHGG